MQRFLGLGDGQSSGNCDPSSLIGKAFCMVEGQDTSGYTQCSNQADADPSYAAVQAQLQTVAAWTPTSEYFNPSDVQAVVEQQQALVAQALQALQNVGAACGGAPGCQSGDLIAQNQANLTADPNNSTNVMTRAGVIMNAVSQAQSSLGAVVGSSYVQITGFKSWIQDTLNAVAAAIHATLVIECQIPGWASLAGIVVSGFESFVGVVTSIVGVAANVVSTAVAAGKAVVHTVDVGVGVLGWIFNNWWLVLGIAALGGLAWWQRDRIRGLFSRREHAVMAGFPHGHGEYEVHHDGEIYLFPTKQRAKAQAALLSREHGGAARVVGPRGNLSGTTFRVGDTVRPLPGQHHDVGTVVAVRGDQIRVRWKHARETYNEDAAELRHAS